MAVMPAASGEGAREKRVRWRGSEGHRESGSALPGERERGREKVGGSAPIPRTTFFVIHSFIQAGQGKNAGEVVQMRVQTL